MGSIPITRSKKMGSESLFSHGSTMWAKLVSKTDSDPIFFESAHIAQSVEHFLGKEEVIGSIPIMGSRFCIYMMIVNHH